MDESNVAVYSNVTGNTNGNVLLTYQFTPNQVPLKSNSLQISSSSYIYGNFNGINKFIPIGRGITGSWTSFCPAFYIYTRGVTTTGSITKPKPKVTRAYNIQSSKYF